MVNHHIKESEISKPQPKLKEFGCLIKLFMSRYRVCSLSFLKDSNLVFIALAELYLDFPNRASSREES